MLHGSEYTIVFFFKAEDGIRDLVRSRGLGDVYKRQAAYHRRLPPVHWPFAERGHSLETTEFTV